MSAKSKIVIPKNILAVHDISCMSRCSLTVALPVIAAAGITCTVLPTALLSTHTVGFEGYICRDLTSDMLPMADHWQSLSSRPNFDAIYTGYLGSDQQLAIVAELIKTFKPKLTIIDPVMADFGKLYDGFGPEFPSGMWNLCDKADVITPNMTEALLMLNKPYEEAPYTEDFIYKTLKALGSGKRKVVLTGVHLKDKEPKECYGAVVYDRGEIHYSLSKMIPGVYHGTGDLFASVLSSALVSGCTLNRATDIAVKVTGDSIERTYKREADTKYGVDFELGLSGLRGMIFK